MDELRIVISSLCKSPYLPEWILELRDNEVLFSPRKNIKPCVLLDDKKVQSSYWEGLLLLKNYCDRGFDDPRVNEFTISKINESISIYKQDKANDPYKKLNSSQVILGDLLDIILSKPSFIDGIDFEVFTKLYLESVTAWPFSLVYEMHKAKNVLVRADGKKVFAAYKAICSHGLRKVDYDKYLFVEELILQNPSDYYDFSKEHILNKCLSKVYFNLGSFYEYDLSRPFSEDSIYFQWLKASSLRLSDDVLANDILSFINSENKLLNKVGLCLINLNFERMSHIFFENIGLFFSKRSFYSDLRCLLSQNNTKIFLPENFDLLSKNLKDATFGLEDEKTIRILKNRLSKIYTVNGIKTPFYEEKPSDSEVILNFGKEIYPAANHESENIKIIRDSIRGKKIDEAIEIFSDLPKASHYYEDIVFKAFTEYLLEFYPETFCEYLARFGAPFSNHLLFYFSNDKSFSEKQLVRVIRQIIKNIRENDSFKECLSQLLYSLDKLSDNVDFETLKEIVTAIDHRWIDVVEYEKEETKDVIQTCINEDLRQFLELRGYVAQKANDSELIRKPVKYLIEKNSCSKLKSIIAFVFPRLLAVDEEYALSLTDYVFNNINGSINLSYPLLAISGGVNERVLEIISKRDDFVHFLSENVESQEDRTALSFFFQRLLKSFVFDKKYGELVRIQFYTEQFDAILMCIRNLNYWFESKAMGDAEIKQCRIFLDLLSLTVRGCKKEIPEVDQLIREVANTIILSNDFSQKAWQALLLLFKHFKWFFSDEVVELIKKYKDKKVNEITEILTLYFSSYEPYFFRETLVKVFNLIAKEEGYAENVKKWKVSLLNKDSSLRSVLV